MKTDSEETIAYIVTEQRYAGIARRMAAYIADICILATGVMATQLGLQAATNGFPFNQFKTGQQIEAWILATVSLPSWLYFILQERSHAQATLGKRLLGLRVTDLQGKRIGLGRATLRTAVKFFPWELTHLSLMLPVPIWWDKQPGVRPGLIAADILLVVYLGAVLLTPRKQSIDDLVAGTVELESAS